MPKIDVSTIRNVAFVGHGAVGKTTLVDGLLACAKAVDRKGSVEDGSSNLDFDVEEKARKHSIDSALGYLDWKGERIQVIDTPGAPDFIGQAISAIWNVEAVAVVIDAHKGIEVNTRRLFEEARKAGVARYIIFNKLDGDNIHFEKIVGLVKETFGEQCVLFQAPIGIGSSFSGVVNVLTPPANIPAGVVGDPAAMREAIVERVVETDDELLEKFLEGEVPSDDVLMKTMTRAIAEAKIVPMFCVSAKKDIGLTELLEELAEATPSPAVGLARVAKAGDKEVPLVPDASKPFVGRVFKTLADKFGNLTFIRIYQGSLGTNMSVKTARDGQSHRLGQLNHPQGKNLTKIDEAGPGEFVVVAKVEGVEINDTLSSDGALAMPPVVFPKPMFPLAVGAKERRDDAKVIMALRKYSHEDPCFELVRDDQTLETVMYGTSQLHLETVRHRLVQRDGVELVTHEPKIPYKETISKSAEGMYRHKKQTGGRGQFAEVHLKLHPRARGEGFEFINSIVGGVIPGQYIPAVEKGIREVLTQGVLAGCQVVDIAAEVHFGKFHDVDSSEQAFKYASAMAFKEAFSHCGPMLLEPIVALEVVVPSEKMGDINSDLNTRRAQITGMDVLAGGLQVVKANVPLAEVLRYQTELKSMTAGQGSFSMEFSHLAPVPPNIQQQVIEKYNKTKQEAAHAH